MSSGPKITQTLQTHISGIVTSYKQIEKDLQDEKDSHNRTKIDLQAVHQKNHNLQRDFDSMITNRNYYMTKYKEVENCLVLREKHITKLEKDVNNLKFDLKNLVTERDSLKYSLDEKETLQTHLAEQNVKLLDKLEEANKLESTVALLQRELVRTKKSQPGTGHTQVEKRNPEQIKEIVQHGNNQTYEKYDEKTHQKSFFKDKENRPLFLVTIFVIFIMLDPLFSRLIEDRRKKFVCDCTDCREGFYNRDEEPKYSHGILRVVGLM